MSRIKGAYIMPHPPIIVPFIGRQETSKASATINAMQTAAKRISELAPETVIVISPHGNVFDDYIFMMNERTLRGNFAKFGHYGYEESFRNDVDLLGEIINLCRQDDFPAGILNPELRKQLNITDRIDHGALVPLYFIKEQYRNFKVLLISIANLDKRNMYRFGEYIKDAVGNIGKDVVLIASGDLSHYLSDESPYGFRKEGPEFDQKFVGLLKQNDLAGILNLPEHLSDRAGQCGLKGFEILAGAVAEERLGVEVLSYEGPFGIGYAVADLFGKAGDDPYVRLAYEAIRHYFSPGKGQIDLDAFPDEMKSGRAAVFVSLKKDGDLRGCIGTLEPCRENIAREIMENALSAAFRDPRFEPLEPGELDMLDISVDVLSEPEPVEDISCLDPKRYGVIVRKGMRRGVLLPDLEGVDEAGHQVSIALAKAGIGQEERYSMERFEVVRHK